MSKKVYSVYLILIILLAGILSGYFILVHFRLPAYTGSDIATAKTGNVSFLDFKIWLDGKGIHHSVLYDEERAKNMLGAMLEEAILQNENRQAGFSLFSSDGSKTLGDIKKDVTENCDTTVSRSAARAYYGRHRDFFHREEQLRFCHLRFDGKKELKETVETLESRSSETGSPRQIMLDLSRELRSRQKGKKVWGDLGWLVPRELPAWFRREAEGLKNAGDYAAFSSPAGHHIVMLMHVRPAKTFDTEEVTPYITSQIIFSRKEDLWRDHIDSLFKLYGVCIIGANLKERLLAFKAKDMVRLDGGSFRAGFTDAEIEERYYIWREYVQPHVAQEEPGWAGYAPNSSRILRVQPFFIDRYEVSYDDYKRFIEETGYAPLPEWVEKFLPAGDHPVVGVNWYDAKAYCEWRGKRLPAPEEWEFAAKGTENRLYPWGNRQPDGRLGNTADRNSEVPWRNAYIDDGFIFTAPVESFPEGVTPEGVYNMGGNVKEWTDTLAPGDEKAAAKGGSFNNSFDDMMAADQRMTNKLIRTKTIGFRCACDAR